MSHEFPECISSSNVFLYRTNGGPGCSSLEGLLQENGVRMIGVFIQLNTTMSLLLQPFSWSWGQAIPTVNEFSWTNLSSILFVEQPVGTGFSQGTPDIMVNNFVLYEHSFRTFTYSFKDEVGVANQLIGFFQQFLEVFSELKGKNFYVSGESVSYQSRRSLLFIYWIIPLVRRDVRSM